jgi:hypothetical protein
MTQILRSIPIKITGSDDLYNMVRAALIARGTNLNRWCKTNRINRQTVDKALKGERIGRRAQVIRDRLVQELFDEEAGRAA